MTVISIIEDSTGRPSDARALIDAWDATTEGRRAGQRGPLEVQNGLEM